MTGTHQIIAGFMPLLDSSILVAAKETGFADTEGIDLKLVRETSWTTIRDRMAVGHCVNRALGGANNHEAPDH